MPTDEELYNDLAYYTLAHPDPAFIHQLLVDAYTAQHADANTKPIAITFALIGLYLVVEKNFTGKQVQRVHMQLARSRKVWPSFSLPVERGTMTVADVASVPPGAERDAAIHQWCAAVWEAWRGSRELIAGLLRNELEIW
ncbi:MAG: DUF5946 family protein [Acidobacteriaceae bacterium]|jgi:hypothetical protein